MTPTHPMREKIVASLKAEARGKKYGAVTSYEAVVIAVLRVLREPDEGMVEAANTAYEHDWEYGISDDDMAKAITAAIDSILPQEKGNE